MKIKHYVQLVMAILLCSHSDSSYSDFMVTQTSFGVDLEQPVTKETTLINQSDKPVRVRVDFAKPQWAKDQYYLGDQLVVYPKIVVIPPSGKIQVMIVPRIKKDLADGEYVALLVLKELPPLKGTGQVSMPTNIGIPYYGRKGKLKTVIDFDNLRMVKVDKGYQLKGALINSGNFSYSLNIIVKFYHNQKLIKKKNFKQGFYREYLVNLNKSIFMDEDADYVEIVFANKKLNFSNKFNFAI
ncbi:MAG: P pilus assembly chaperone PapD [Paraglaciecola sp.]|jgi:P pilus assembly chaperone PapD